ncbi:ABC transporter substrate-binding protein [Rhodobacterales bacterium HKCCE2091]|nr:ABC transporter substrate-binding protein [Rhodobacterales bacterium HKCCE2091]
MSFRTGSLACALSAALCAWPALAQDTETPEVETPDADTPEVVLPNVALPAEPEEICYGLGTSVEWIAGDEAGSDISTAEAFLQLDAVEVAPNGNFVTAFSVTEAGDYRVEAAATEFGDTVIELFAADGTLVLTDDDSGGSLASRAETQLQPGSYCLLTRGYAGGAVVADVRVGTVEMEPLTQGLADPSGFFAGVQTCTPDTPATPLGSGALDTMLEQGVTVTNSVSQTPYYRFTLAEPQAVTIRAENEWADPYIYIFDGDGTLIAENDDYDSLNSRIDFTSPLAAGDYCIAMRALSDQNQPVTVTVRGYDPRAAMFDLYSQGNASPPDGSGYPITELGVLSSRLVYDQPVGHDAVFYGFSVPQGGLLVIDAIEITDSDPVIRLFDGSGREIAFNDDSNGTLDSQITARVGPGNYMLGVTQYSSGYTGVIRVTIERFVPAQ